VSLIISNRDKYSISALCKFLEVPRSLVYYHLNNQDSPTLSEEDIKITEHIKRIFRESKNNYGQRKIKVELQKLGYQISRRKIGKIMKENGLVSNYTVAQFKPTKTTCNQSNLENLVKREFNDRDELEVCVSDLTYVRVGTDWNYICSIIDLSNREIIGCSVGKYKDTGLVKSAIYSIRRPLDKIQIFHTDRGNEYDNKLIDEVLDTFKIKRSLSAKGSPYDNAVSEATNKIIKTEFVYQDKFETLEELKLKLAVYVYWYNNKRIHGSLGYLTPVEYKEVNFKSKLSKAS
jgi:putative transposase